MSEMIKKMCEPVSEEKVKVLGVEASKEKWKKGIEAEVETWAKWVVRLTIVSIWIASFYAYWVQHDLQLAILYSILAVVSSISNKLYNLEKQIKSMGAR